MTRAKGAPILVLADLHGHLDLFERAVARGRELAGREDVTVVTLGDYCDNGPDVPGLLERLVGFGDEHPGRFLPLLGNHDLACLLTLGWPAGGGDAFWWRRWRERYPNGLSQWTPTQYGARTLDELQRCLPPAHRAFLSDLPWARRVGGYVFVHAGLAPGAIGPQLEELARRDMRPYAPGHQPPALRDKARAQISDPGWEAVVVSGHTKLADRRDFLGSRRLTLHAGTCRGEALHAALLPPRPAVEGPPAAERFVVGP